MFMRTYMLHIYIQKSTVYIYIHIHESPWLNICYIRCTMKKALIWICKYWHYITLILWNKRSIDDIVHADICVQVLKSPGIRETPFLEGSAQQPRKMKWQNIWPPPVPTPSPTPMQDTPGPSQEETRRRKRKKTETHTHTHDAKSVWVVQYVVHQRQFKCLQYLCKDANVAWNACCTGAGNDAIPMAA